MMLAVLHAHWWGPERLAEAGAPIHDTSHIRRFVEIAPPGVAHILKQFSSEFKPLWPATMHDLFDHHP
jgi:hypothetical protein